MKINGMEITQGVQFFQSHRHLIDNFGPDNSLRLVASKPAWVRIYVRSQTDSSVPNVTGTLALERMHQGIYTSLATLTPRPPGIVTAHPDLPYEDERRNLQRTLNFVIPSDLMCGRLKLTARITGARRIASRTIQIDVTLLQRLKIRGVVVAYDGPDDSGNPVKLPAPTLSNLIQAGAWLAPVYPIASDPHFSIGCGFTHNSSVASVKDGCGHPSNWGGLMTNYLEAKQCDGTKPGYVYYGLLAVDHPGANSAGCGGPDFVFSGAGEGVDFQVLDGTWALTAETTMAHELGHHLGRQHAPGLTPDPDPNYPKYQAALPGQSYDDGSIGEYGLDVNTGTVYPPYAYADFMSYQVRRWISPYGWKSFLNRLRLNSSFVCAEVPPWLERYREWPPKMEPVPPEWRKWRYRPVISVVALLGPGRYVEVQSVTRSSVASAPDDPTPYLAGDPTPYVVELVGHDGNRLAASAFRSSMAVACGDCHAAVPGDAVVAEARLPDVAPGAALRVTHDGEELWRREAPPSPPEILSFDAVLADQDTLAASWNVRASDERALHYWLQWSFPAEADWHGLVVGLRGDQARVGVNPISPGDVRIRLVAHDGFFSVSSGPVAVVIPPRPASVTIVSPFREQGVYAGGTLRLFAMISAATSERNDADAVRWLVNGREVGRGAEVFIETPPPGEHHCEVRVELDGTQARDEVVFRTFVAPSICDH